MASIQTIPPEEAAGKLQELYDDDLKSLGYVANYTQAMSLRPEVIAAWCRERCYKSAKHRVKKSPERRIKCTLLIPIRRYSHATQGGLHHD